MPEYMNEFDDDFEFKDLPDESTPINSKNLGRALKNTRLLKRFINDVITGKIDLVVKDIKSKNYFRLPESKEINGITYINNNDGTFNISGTSTNSVNIDFKINKNNSKFVVGETYTLSSTQNLGDLQVWVQNQDFSSLWKGTYYYITGNQKSSAQFKDFEGDYILFRLLVPANKTIDLKNVGIMLEEGSEVTKGFGPYIDF